MFYSIRDVARLSKASIYLLQQFKGKYKSCTKAFMEPFILKLLLTVKLLALYITICQKSPDLLSLINSRKVKVSEALSDALNSWVCSAIGGTVFGGRVSQTAAKSVVFDKSEEEFEVRSILAARLMMWRYLRCGRASFQWSVQLIY